MGEKNIDRRTFLGLTGSSILTTLCLVGDTKLRGVTHFLNQDSRSSLSQQETHSPKNTFKMDDFSFLEEDVETRINTSMGTKNYTICEPASVVNFHTSTKAQEVIIPKIRRFAAKIQAQYPSAKVQLSKEIGVVTMANRDPFYAEAHLNYCKLADNFLRSHPSFSNMPQVDWILPGEKSSKNAIPAYSCLVTFERYNAVVEIVLNGEIMRTPLSFNGNAELMGKMSGKSGLNIHNPRAQLLEPLVDFIYCSSGIGGTLTLDAPFSELIPAYTMATKDKLAHTILSNYSFQDIPLQVINNTIFRTQQVGEAFSEPLARYFVREMQKEGLLNGVEKYLSDVRTPCVSQDIEMYRDVPAGCKLLDKVGVYDFVAIYTQDPMKFMVTLASM